MMMSGPALVSMAEAIRGFRSFMLIRSTVTSTPASFPNSATSRLNSTSEAGTKLNHSRMRSFVPFGKLGAFCAATIPGMPPATAAPVATPAAFRKARLLTLAPPSDFAMAHPRAAIGGWIGETLGITSSGPGLVKSPRWSGQGTIGSRELFPKENNNGCLDDDARAGRGAGLRVPLEGIQLDGGRPRPHRRRGVRGGRLAADRPPARRKPPRVLRAGHRRARAGLLSLRPGREHGTRHRGWPLRSLLGAERGHAVGRPARLHGRIGADHVRGHRRHVRRARSLRLHDGAKPGRRPPG